MSYQQERTITYQPEKTISYTPVQAVSYSDEVRWYYERPPTRTSYVTRQVVRPSYVVEDVRPRLSAAQQVVDTGYYVDERPRVLSTTAKPRLSESKIISRTEKVIEQEPKKYKVTRYKVYTDENGEQKKIISKDVTYHEGDPKDDPTLSNARYVEPGKSVLRDVPEGDIPEGVDVRYDN